MQKNKLIKAETILQIQAFFILVSRRKIDDTIVVQDATFPLPQPHSRRSDEQIRHWLSGHIGGGIRDEHRPLKLWHYHK